MNVSDHSNYCQLQSINSSQFVQSTLSVLVSAECLLNTGKDEAVDLEASSWPKHVFLSFTG